MLQIPRSAIRDYRVALRKTFTGAKHTVVCQGSLDGLTLQTTADGITLSLHLEGPQEQQRLVVKSDDLRQVEGRDPGLITLETLDSGNVLARWTQGRIPCVQQLSTVKATEDRLPDAPSKWKSIDGSFASALNEAMKSVLDMTGHGISRVQLRGDTGEIVGTDGRQLLMYGGFELPWKDKLLIPKVGFFGWKDVQQETIELGSTADHVWFRVGKWTLSLPIDKDARYPRVENVIPDLGSATHITIDPDDADWLIDSLIRLPTDESGKLQVTIDVGDQVVLRVPGIEGQANTEIVLAKSSYQGNPVVIASHHDPLLRALQLGFRKLSIVDSRPLVCQDDNRRYVWVGIDKKLACQPTANAIRISSTDAVSTPTPKSERTGPTVKISPPARIDKVPGGNDIPATHDQTAPPSGFNSLIEEAKALQSTLRDALLRSNQLVQGLKRHRRNAKTMQATLATLRQLQNAA